MIKYIHSLSAFENLYRRSVMSAHTAKNRFFGGLKKFRKIIKCLLLLIFFGWGLVLFPVALVLMASLGLTPGFALIVTVFLYWIVLWLILKL